MWTPIKKTATRMVAEMWQLFFEGEGIPARIMGDPGGPDEGEVAPYEVLVPTGMVQVAEEALRKI